MGSLIGAFLGLTWASALRAWMTHLTLEFGSSPVYTWRGTFLSVLLPATIIGAVIGWDWQRRRDGHHGNRLVMWSPLLLVVGPAVLADNFIGTLMNTAEGGGAIGVVMLGMAGGFSMSGRGRAWVRTATGILAAAAVVGLAYGFYAEAGPFSASDAFGALFFTVLMIWLAVACAIPMRRVSGSTAVPGEALPTG